MDVNGVEIYEGDVCTMRMPDYYDKGVLKKVEDKTVFFEWKNNGWFLNGFNSLYGTYYWGGVEGEMLEVVGNIYETTGTTTPF